MKEWVGVLHATSCVRRLPKRELLLFDKVAILDIEGALKTQQRKDIPWADAGHADELEFLADQGLLVPTEMPPEDFYEDPEREIALRMISTLNDAMYKTFDQGWKIVSQAIEQPQSLDATLAKEASD